MMLKKALKVLLTPINPTAGRTSKLSVASALREPAAVSGSPLTVKPALRVASPDQMPSPPAGPSRRAFLRSSRCRMSWMSMGSGSRISGASFIPAEDSSSAQ